MCLAVAAHQNTGSIARIHRSIGGAREPLLGPLAPSGIVILAEVAVEGQEGLPAEIGDHTRAPHAEDRSSAKHAEPCEDTRARDVHLVSPAAHLGEQIR